MFFLKKKYLGLDLTYILCPIVQKELYVFKDWRIEYHFMRIDV